MESITDYWDIEKCATLKGLHLEVLTSGSNDFVSLRNRLPARNTKNAPIVYDVRLSPDFRVDLGARKPLPTGAFALHPSNAFGCHAGCA